MKYPLSSVLVSNFKSFTFSDIDDLGNALPHMTALLGALYYITNL